MSVSCLRFLVSCPVYFSSFHVFSHAMSLLDEHFLTNLWRGCVARVRCMRLARVLRVLRAGLALACTVWLRACI